MYGTLPIGGSSPMGPEPSQHQRLFALEKQLELAMRQVEHTKRMYERLHEHNDDMETEFLRLRGLLEGVRNRLHFSIRHDINRLRRDAESIRETVTFHTVQFRRELQALGRVLHSALSQQGTPASTDVELLTFRSRGQLSVAGAGARGSKQTGTAGPVDAPLPVSHTATKTPPRAERPPAHPQQRPAPQNPLTSLPALDSGDRSFGGHDSSIEFFSDAEAGGAAGPSTPRPHTKHHATGSSGPRQAASNVSGVSGGVRRKRSAAAGSSMTTTVSQQSGGGMESVHGGAASPTNPPLFVAQAAELAQQRVTAERQSKLITQLSDELQRAHHDRVALQERVQSQESQFQLYLKQIKQMHKDQEATLQDRIAMLTALHEHKRLHHASRPHNDNHDDERQDEDHRAAAGFFGLPAAPSGPSTPQEKPMSLAEAAKGDHAVRTLKHLLSEPPAPTTAASSPSKPLDSASSGKSALLLTPHDRRRKMLLAEAKAKRAIQRIEKQGVGYASRGSSPSTHAAHHIISAGAAVHLNATPSSARRSAAARGGDAILEGAWAQKLLAQRGSSARSASR